MVEALLLISALTAISLAMTALFDLLTGRRSWSRKAAWALLVVSLPVLGPVLYYLHAPREPPRQRSARRRARSSPAPTQPRGDQPDPQVPDGPEAADDVANVEPVDRKHAQLSPDP